MLSLLEYYKENIKKLIIIIINHILCTRHYVQTQESGTVSPMYLLFVIQLNVKLELNSATWAGQCVVHTHPPHLRPKAMRADFNLSRPRDANSYRNKTTILCETTLMKTLLPRKTGNKNVTFVTLTSQEEKADRSRWAPAWVRALLVSFCNTFTEKHPYSFPMHISFLKFVKRHLPQLTKLVIYPRVRALWYGIKIWKMTHDSVLYSNTVVV